MLNHWQLFAALYFVFDLILSGYRIMKMSSLAPSPGCTLEAIFQEKIPKINLAPDTAIALDFASDDDAADECQ